jgi:hypothetical protein
MQVLLPSKCHGAGVTIITHGYANDANGWVAAMADAIPNYYSFPGSNFTTYKLTLTTDGNGNYQCQPQRDGGSSPSDTDSGEIIVKLDWSQMAGGSGVPYDYSTYTVAPVASSFLMQSNTIPELNGHSLVEFPIHLIGHSRGGSLMNQISYILGTNGLWVDHVTTLDPHPLNSDGNHDSTSLPTDASASNTWANVLFRDNYWQTISSGHLLDPTGEAASGAYNRKLTALSGGYTVTDPLTAYHYNLHLWYHGTLNWITPTTYNDENDTATIDASMRTNWWVPYEDGGTNAGFGYSLIGGSNRMTAVEPVGSGSPAIVDGYNQHWNVGAGILKPNRTLLPSNKGTWANIIKFNVTGTNVVAVGDSIKASLYYQYAGKSSLTISMYLVQSFNPYKVNGTLALQLHPAPTGAGSVSFYNNSLTLNTTNIPPGRYAVYASITDGVHTRYLYAPEPVTIMPKGQPPLLTITTLQEKQMRIGVGGVSGQTIVLQTSADLVKWVPLVTNTLASSNWTFTNTTAPATTKSFYRAMLVQKP